MRHLNRPIPGCDDSYFHERCLVAPSPEAQARLTERLREAAARAGLGPGTVGLVPLDRGGFNDGLIKPGTEQPLGMPLRVATHPQSRIHELTPRAWAATIGRRAVA